MARILGIDLGERRIGIAISSPEGGLAVPLRILDALIDETRADGAVPVFLYLPTGLEVGLEVLGRAGAVSERETFLLDHCTRRDVACASARSEFSAAAAAGAHFSTVLHWGQEGHRAAASALAKLLRGADLAAPSPGDP